MAEQPPILGFAAFSGAGKTTLLSKLLPALQQRGLRVGVVKHAHHDFDIDYPGKDSYELRKAGARQILVGSRHRFALIVERESDEEPRLAELLPRLLAEELDLILVEGFKPEAIPKIEVHRPALGQPLLCREDDSFVAVASDRPLSGLDIPVLDLNDTSAIAHFIFDRIGLR